MMAGGWQKELVPGDEMWGVHPYNQYKYADDIGIYRFEDRKVAFSIQTFKSDFERETVDANGTEKIPCLLMFYDKENTMTEKLKIYLLIDERDEDVAYADEKEEWCEKVYKHILFDEGAVRFVVHRVHGKDYDFFVPCLKNQ